MKFQPNEIIASFDQYLDAQALSYEAIVIGGAALSLLGVITRTTRDVDLLTSPIPPIIGRHAKLFAHAEGLAENWLNDAPQSLKKELPPGWEFRVQKVYQGSALTLWTLARPDLLVSKLYAACDRDADDARDLLAMAPTEEEIQVAYEWVASLDGNPKWPTHVSSVVQRLKKESR